MKLRLSMNYDLFKYQMKMIKLYREYKEDLENEIDDIIYRYCGVKGINYDKEMFTNSSYTNDNKLLDLSEKLEEPQKALETTYRAINELEPIVNANLDKLPADIKEIVIDIFWNNKTFEQIGYEVGYSNYGIWNKVKKEIQKI